MFYPAEFNQYFQWNKPNGVKASNNDSDEDGNEDDSQKLTDGDSSLNWIFLYEKSLIFYP